MRQIQITFEGCTFKMIILFNVDSYELIKSIVLVNVFGNSVNSKSYWSNCDENSWGFIFTLSFARFILSDILLIWQNIHLKPSLVCGYHILVPHCGTRHNWCSSKFSQTFSKHLKIFIIAEITLESQAIPARPLKSELPSN